MMVFRKSIPRRTFLRGAGTALALPLLDAMLPAFATARQTATLKATRLSFLAVPNGIIMDQWTPDHARQGLLDHACAGAAGRIQGSDGDPERPRKQRSAEARVRNRRRSSTRVQRVPHGNPPEDDIGGGYSLRRVGGPGCREGVRQADTQLPSLEIGLEMPMAGACESAYSCVYYNTISWSGPEIPLPMENRPRAVFERLVGDSTEPCRARGAHQRKSQHPRPRLTGLEAVDAARLERAIG